MGPFANPGHQQATSDAVHWVFKDSGEPMQLYAILLLGLLALGMWFNARSPGEETEDE